MIIQHFIFLYHSKFLSQGVFRISLRRGWPNAGKNQNPQNSLDQKLTPPTKKKKKKKNNNNNNPIRTDKVI